MLAQNAGYRSAGISGYIRHLIAALPDADPAFVYSVFTGAQAAPPARAGLIARCSRMNTVSPLKRIAWEQLAQPFAVRGAGIDLLHALAFAGPLISRVPQVVTVYDLSFIHYPDVLPASRRLYLRLFTRLSCQRARRVIAISESTARDVADHFGLPRAKIDVALPGVTERFHPLPADEVAAFRQRAGLPDRFLLFVGTLEPRKNVPVLLRAYAQIPPADRAAVHLVLAGGKGWMYDEIFQTIEQHGLGETVHLPGYLDDADLPLWYNAADALVYPSVFEGFGLPVIEAMACATPVLVSESSSLPEAAGDTGFLLPPDDPAAWADALARVISDPVWRADAGARAQARAAGFTWANTAAQTVASYRRALDQA
ncbi:glycosyltransferase family 4 protein [Aggregatilinea lenta]|uniref:glycosyltransferase family 4 protein n=1 Tax=Aggregatilinea lenta TaxID=913108 RepID=UPI0013C2DD1A|nr:glycosyltransferase family 1 protein [Aggregatilinea lenta]